MTKKTSFGKFCKDKMIDEITSRMKEHPDFIVTSFMGSTVSDLELLRRNLKASSSSYFIVKNSVLRIVFDKLKLESQSRNIDGGMGVSLSGPDILATCRTLSEFAKAHGKFKIKGAVIDGDSVSSDKVARLAKIQSRETLLGACIGALKSPITGFVNVLGGALRKFLYAIDAIKSAKQKEPQKP